MFYYSFKKSVSYGRYLAEELAKEVEEEADETTEGIWEGSHDASLNQYKT